MIGFIPTAESTMAEFVYWFQLEFPDLAKSMKESNHSTNNPNPYHLEDSVFTHTMMVCQEAKNDPIQNKLAALFHDLGKPLSRNLIEKDIQKATFFGHEGLSFWMAIEPLNKLEEYGCITTDEKREILHMISLHDKLFQKMKEEDSCIKEYKPETIVNMFQTEGEFNRFVKQCKNDAEGRFYLSKKPPVNLGIDIYNADTWKKYKKIPDHSFYLSKMSKRPPESTLTVLVGLPASGKSTYINNLKETKNFEIVSRDNFIIEKGIELGLTDLNYSEVFKTLTNEEQDEITTKTFKKFTESIKKDLNVIVDMTNMSKKSRNKWLSSARKYKKHAVVFATDLNEIKKRNISRNSTEGKFIPEYVFNNMMQSFTVPTLEEFDSIEYIF